MKLFAALVPGASVALLLAGASLLGAENATIYPVFEGWAPNPNGTATLVFGYYNHSAAAVELPAGSDNGFEPGPQDRGQPVLFLPGRQRNVCRMVVAGGFEGNMQWRITHGGVASETTERGGLDPLYLLEEIGSAFRATRTIDFDTAEHGVCLNGAPTARVAPELSAKIGQAIELRGFVSDDGLPRGSALAISWRQLSGPADAKISSSDQATARVTFPMPGEYLLELTAGDGEGTSSDEVRVTVSE